METVNFNQYESAAEGTLSRIFMARVFGWMFAGLALTAITAVFFAADETLMRLLINDTGRGLSILGYVVMFAPIGFVLLMSLAINKLSYYAMLGLFLVYALINGISFSFIFLAYNLGTIFVAFGSAAGMFGLMAILGYTTKTDLTKFGSIMIMGLFGIVIASLINMFLHNSMFDYIISFVGVLVFTGLTAYDVQKLKNVGAQAQEGDVMVKKIGILGALTLYLDFINLFLMLLRLLGGRKS